MTFVLGGAYYIKCEGKDHEGKDCNSYLKINSQNKLIATDKREDASEFEIVEDSKGCFSIKSGTKYLRLPGVQGQPLIMGGEAAAIFSLGHDFYNYCTVEKFKECEERFHIVHPNDFFLLKDRYMSLVSLSEGTGDKIATLQHFPSDDRNVFVYFKLDPLF